MSWKIIYRDEWERREIVIEDAEYEEIVKWLNKPRMARLRSGVILNLAFVRIIEPNMTQQPIPKQFRLEEPKFEGEKLSAREGLFNFLKSKGFFGNYENYAQYTEKRYEKINQNKQGNAAGKNYRNY